MSLMNEDAPALPGPNPGVFIDGIPYRSSTFPSETTTAIDDLQEIDRDDKPLDDLLRKYPVEGAKGTSSYWPLTRLLRIMSRKRVLAELQTYSTPRELTHKRLEAIRPEDNQFSRPCIQTYLRTFAILLLLGRGDEIGNFVEEEVSDQNLPVYVHSTEIKGQRRQVNLSPVCTPSKLFTCFQGWKPHEKEYFQSTQWQLLPHYFELEGGKVAKHYVVDEKTILPICKASDGSTSSAQPSGQAGSFGYVSAVKIEPSSHDFGELLRSLYLKDDLFALKVLHDRIDNENKFRNEMEQLRRFNGSAHPHLVTLLSTYTVSGRYHFIFPYANSTLEAYWQDIEPNPKMDISTVRWVSRQFVGIMGAVAVIHDPKHLPNLTADSKRYGRHGDIKPDNILWFRSSKDERGMLVVTDMGLSDIRREQSKSGIPRYNIAKVPGYQPPECDVNGGTISRAYDVWTLGCLFLELLTWLLGGWDLTERFEKFRSSIYPITGVNKPLFFTLHQLKTTEDQKDRWAAQVKPQIEEWFRLLHSNEKCSQFIHECLDILEKEMLIVLYVGRNRTSSKALLKKFEHIYENCMNDSDSDYCLKGKPTTRPVRTGTVVEVDLTKDAKEAVSERRSALPVFELTGELKKSPLPKDLEEMEKLPYHGHGQ